MSTQYYLNTIPENTLNEELSIRVRRSLIKEHSLQIILRILDDYSGDIEDETVKVLNRGIRGPYLTGSLYCGFNFEDEYSFWKEMTNRYPNSGYLNMIYADYVVQKENEYTNAHKYYTKAFELNYRLIFAMEPSWRDALIETDFKYELHYLKTQKDDFDNEDFIEIVERLIKKYENDKIKVEEIKTIANK